MLECLDEVRHPLLLLLGGHLDEGEAGKLILHPRPTHWQWERCSRWWSSHGDYRYECLTCPDSLLLHLLVKQFGNPPGWFFWELQIFAKSGINCFSQNVMGCVSFLTLTSGHSPLWQQYRQWNSLRRGFSDLLYCFLKLLKLFLAVVSDFTKSLRWIMGGGKERKMNSRPDTAYQVRDGGKGWNKSFCK